MRCIEITILDRINGKVKGINSNMRCIEIL